MEPIKSSDFDWLLAPRAEERLKPITTYYAGFKFRSRLEARWAVFFHSLNIMFDYEREGYDLGDGLYYLPDFYLTKGRIWLEIKGTQPQAGTDDFEKISRFANQSTEELYLIVGGIGLNNWGHKYLVKPRTPTYDDPATVNLIPTCFLACTNCNKQGFRSYTGSMPDMTCPSCSGTQSIFHDRVVCAYERAQQARFEHGEKP